MLKDLIEAAKEEKFEFIGKEIPQICNVPAYLTWAFDKGVRDSDDNVRNLAVSILEKTRHLNRLTIGHLQGLMSNDKYNPVRYRSAFALAAHDQMDSGIRIVLGEAKKDSQVGEIAKKYLGEK